MTEIETTTVNVPVYFGTLSGAIVGEGSIKETDEKAVVTIEITKEGGLIVDLLKYQLIGFAVVLRPVGNPVSNQG